MGLQKRKRRAPRRRRLPLPPRKRPPLPRRRLPLRPKRRRRLPLLLPRKRRRARARRRRRERNDQVSEQNLYSRHTTQRWGEFFLMIAFFFNLDSIIYYITVY